MTTTPGEPVSDLDIDATGITNESVAASEGTPDEGTGSTDGGDGQGPTDTADAADG